MRRVIRTVVAGIERVALPACEALHHHPCITVLSPLEVCATGALAAARVSAPVIHTLPRSQPREDLGCQRFLNRHLPSISGNAVEVKHKYFVPLLH